MSLLQLVIRPLFLDTFNTDRSLSSRLTEKLRENSVHIDVFPFQWLASGMYGSIASNDIEINIFMRSLNDAAIREDLIYLINELQKDTYILSSDIQIRYKLQVQRVFISNQQEVDLKAL